MPKINIIAQNVMDLFYQDYKTASDFLDLTNFIALASAAYGKILEADFIRYYNMAREEFGSGFFIAASDYVVSEEVEVKEKDGYLFAQLQHMPFSFAYDRSFTSVKELRGDTGECKEFIRVQQDEKSLYSGDMLKVRKVFWTVSGDRIEFLSRRCVPKKINVLYIPRIHEEMEVPDTKVADIISWSLAIVKSSKEGTVIDETNDGNSNKSMATESNNSFPQFKNRG